MAPRPRVGAPRPVACLLALLAGCAVRPTDPFLAGERAAQENDLACALQAYDTVPVDHPRYPEARAAALVVERRMRQSHELILEALLLRSEWRDREALAVLQRVRELWPELPGVAVLVAATEQRLRLMGADATRHADAAAVVELPAAPLAELQSELLPAPPAPQSTPERETPRSAEASPVEVPAAVPPPSTQPGEAEEPLSAATDGADPVALGLVAVETSLARGQLETAVGELLELARRFPADARVRVRLVRLLHQRALLRYGEGALAAAISDWRRVLELAPDHGAARQMLRVAESEGRSRD
jgi:tetratricopeptide (TPR) repeat protein